MQAYTQVKVIGRGAFGAAILCHRTDDRGLRKNELIMKEVRALPLLRCPELCLNCSLMARRTMPVDTPQAALFSSHPALTTQYIFSPSH